MTFAPPCVKCPALCAGFGVFLAPRFNALRSRYGGLFSVRRANILPPMVSSYA